ncbi:DUF397 domain-containing protein [Streptomyces sp. NPDC089424]|uniref:DUF397 domain-containing protein n=1 Tax=Streptomyces sp. NPDC089424 TaxID=3365917 RepID=UPI00382F4D48
MKSSLTATQAPWRKSSYSGSSGGECVEVADLGAHIAVRDSKNPTHGTLTLGAHAFTAFVAALSQVGITTGRA